MEGGINFLKNLFNDPTTIGAIAESSDDLAEEITKFFPKDSPISVRILEVGAGTGVFTRKLAAKLRPGDRLDVIELTSDFMTKLYEEFENNSSVHIYWEDILKFQPDFKPAERYDLIVSGLPFNSFDADTVKRMTNRYLELSKSGTVISFFEYKALPTIRQLLPNSERYKETREVIESFVNQYEVANGNVLLNVPPAVVHHLLITK